MDTFLIRDLGTSDHLTAPVGKSQIFKKQVAHIYFIINRIAPVAIRSPFVAGGVFFNYAISMQAKKGQINRIWPKKESVCLNPFLNILGKGLKAFFPALEQSKQVGFMTQNYENAE